MLSVKIFMHVINIYSVLRCIYFMRECFCLCEGMCTACVPGTPKSQKVPGTGVTDGCEPLFGCWELVLGPLQEEQVL